jgi:hypothetical protein
MKTSVLGAFVLCLSLIGCAARSAECACTENAGFVVGESQASFEQDIRTLMEVTHALELGRQVGGALVKALSSQYPQVPGDFWQKLNGDLTSERFLGMLIPLYQKHLTQDEVRALIDFYQTPAGSSVIAKMPALTQESMALGAALGQELANEFVTRARATGYKI